MGSHPPDRVPTLTEVVAWPDSTPPASPMPAPLESSSLESSPLESPVESSTVESVPLEIQVFTGDATQELPDIGPLEDRIVERVLIDLQRQVDLMLEYRLREVLTPVITRLADNLVRDVRSELASTLREVVTRAVAQELSRHRTS